MHKVALTEVHDALIQGRPIISDNNTPTEIFQKLYITNSNTSKSLFPPLIENTQNLPRIIKDINRNHTFSNDTILATPDVVSLCTNIPIGEGITKEKEMVSNATDQHTAMAYITLLELILTSNFFSNSTMNITCKPTDLSWDSFRSYTREHLHGISRK